MWHWYIVKVMYNVILTMILIVNHICDHIERHSRTTIYTIKTVIIKKSYIEEQMINDQWVTTDEYQVNYHTNGWYLLYTCHVRRC